MRYFLIVSNTVDTSKPLSLNSLTGYGRLDVLCRCISAAFFLSDDFRKNVKLEIFFRKNGKNLEIDGNKVRGINPDERAIAGVLKRVFTGKKYPGIKFYKQSLEEFLKEHQPIMLDVKGNQLYQELYKYSSFLIGDQLGFLAEDKDLFAGLEKMSLGPQMYLSSQTITILNYSLDSQDSLS
jgi:tRNA (pseudouridine54-N1)-methyltransferase